MNTSLPEREKRYMIFPILILTGLFLIYPNRLIAFAPDWIIFAVSTASTALLCAGSLFFAPERLTEKYRLLPGWFKGALLLFTAIQCYHIFLNRGAYTLSDAARMFAYPVIPFFAYVYRNELKRSLPYFLSVMWAATIAQSLVERFMLDTEVLGGLPMNRNWNASLVLVTLPFLCQLIWKRTDHPGVRFVLYLLVILPSLYVVMVCNSLAVYLAVPLVLFLFFLMKRKTAKLFFILSFALLLSGVAGFLICRTNCASFQHYLEHDDRVYLIAETVPMIFDAPVAGYGMPSFEQAFLPYCRTEDFFMREHSVDRANHPHNHLLYMAAGSGLTGLAAWLCLWLVPVLLYAFRKKEKDDPAQDGTDDIIYTTWLLLAIHSMADLVLYQEPNNIIALLLTGMIWGRVFSGRPSGVQCPVFLRKTLCFPGVVLIWLGLIMAFCNLYASFHFRMAHRLWLQGMKEASRQHVREMLRTAHWDNTHYYLYQSAEKLSPEEGMKLLDEISCSAIPDFAHIHSMRGRFLFLLNRPDEGKNELLQDAALYPLWIDSLYDLWMVSLFEKDEPAARRLAAEINRRLQVRGLKAAIRDPYPSPGLARLEGPDAKRALNNY